MSERQGDSISHLSDEPRRDIAAGDLITTALDARPIVASAANKAPADHVDSMRDLLTVALGNQYEIIRELGRGGMGAPCAELRRELELPDA